MDNDSLHTEFEQSELSAEDRELIASALIERYGKYVGNYLIDAVDIAMRGRDHVKLGDLLAISEALEKILGGQADLQPEFPKDLIRSH